MKKNITRMSIIKKRGYRKNIKGDKFSLYISNFPVTVEYLKRRVGNRSKTLAELCCGVGITLTYITDSFRHVVGVDIDKCILKNCATNLDSVNLLQKATLILGDVNDKKILENIKADIVIYDIPFWSEHKDRNQGNLTSKNPELKDVLNKIRKYITKDIIIFCPPKFKYSIIKSQAGPCEFQKVFINGKHDRNHVYLGELKQEEGIVNLELNN